MATSMIIKAENDLISITDMIYKICDHEQVLNMFQKGPPKDTGFMWWNKMGGPEQHFTELEAKALNEISGMVLKYGWESSGYAIMLRKIQDKILNDTKTLNKFGGTPIYHDDEGKWDGDDRNGIGYKSNH
jgi:hypothetical protein